MGIPKLASLGASVMLSGIAIALVTPIIHAYAFLSTKYNCLRNPLVMSPLN